MFDGIKKMLNIGRANIAMLLGNDTYSQCEIVSGVILVLGGEHEQLVSSVMVELKKLWTEQLNLDDLRKQAQVKSSSTSFSRAL